MSRIRPLAFCLLLSAGLGLTGCQSARVISKDESGGVISIPSNTDMWPFRYRTKANELLAQQCPEGYVIEREEQVVTGQQTVVQEEEQNRTQQISKRASLSLGSTTTTETTSDITEWRIYYRKKTAEDDAVADREPERSIRSVSGSVDLDSAIEAEEEASENQRD